MAKIKLNLVSGGVVEKPLVNAFKANNNQYVVLDNETIGQMGLPIILVCKLENDKLSKIVDPNEWQIVKEYLKNIIAGNQIELIKVSKEMNADDIYYTQLTLPVPSFDSLKNAYGNLGDEEVVASPEVTSESVNPISDFDQIINNNPVEENITNTVNTPVNDNEPVNMEMQEEVVSNVNDIEQNIINPLESNITTASEPVVENTTMNVETPVNMGPEVETSVTNEVVENTNTEIFSDEKEAFMNACENMFEALVQRFKKEMENNK